jgi:hypothetical protein
MQKAEARASRRCLSFFLGDWEDVDARCHFTWTSCGTSKRTVSRGSQGAESTIARQLHLVDAFDEVAKLDAGCFQQSC